MLGHLSKITNSSERMHTLTNQVAAGLSVVDVAPSREAIDQRVAAVAATPLPRRKRAFSLSSYAHPLLTRIPRDIKCFLFPGLYTS
jgi:hypothetical protein